MNDSIKKFSTKKKYVQKLKARLCFLRSYDQMDKFLNLLGTSQLLRTLLRTAKELP